MTRTLSRPPTESRLSLEDVQHFVFEDVSWGFYESMLREVGNRPIRLTYDQGRLEIMSPLPEHEDVSEFMARMIGMLAFDMDRPVKCLGSTTFNRKDLEKGVEPDHCFYFRDEAKMRGRKRLNMKKDPPPELVVEVDITSRSVPREPIYAALGVPEIWRWDGQKLECLHLTDGVYRAAKNSLVFPFLQPSLMTQFVQQLWEKDENSILREFLEWARKKSAAT